MSGANPMEAARSAQDKTASSTDTYLTHDAPMKGYSQVYNNVTLCPDVSDSAFRTYCILKTHDHGNGVFPGLHRLACLQGVTRRTIQHNIDQLKGCGLIVVTRRGLGRTNEYVMADATRVKVAAGRPVTPEIADVKSTSHQPDSGELSGNTLHIRSGSGVHIHSETDVTSNVNSVSPKEDVRIKKTEIEENKEGSTPLPPTDPSTEAPGGALAGSPDEKNFRETTAFVSESIGVTLAAPQLKALRGVARRRAVSMDVFCEALCGAAEEVCLQQGRNHPIHDVWRYYLTILDRLLSEEQDAPQASSTPATAPPAGATPEEPSAPPANDWEALCAAMRHTVTADYYAMWFARTGVIGTDPDGTHVVEVPDEGHRRWLAERLAARLAREALMIGIEAPFRFVVAPEGTPV